MGFQRTVGKNLALYLPVAWMVIEASSYFISRYQLDELLVDIVIIFLLHGLIGVLISTFFKGRKNKKAIAFQSINVFLAFVVVIVFALNPLLFNPSKLRILPLIQNDNPLKDLSSIAVLPIENNLGNNEQDYLLAGLHDDLITEIGKTGTIKTISRTSMKTFTETNKTIKQIGKELDVQAILESGLFALDQEYELRLKIFDSKTENILWAGEYVTSMNQLPKTLEAITEIVSKTIDKANYNEIKINENLSPMAYEEIVKGNELILAFEPASIKKSLLHFQRAIEFDSSNIEGYIGVARGWIYLEQLGSVDPRVSQPEIRKYFSMAQEIDSNHWQTLIWRGVIESLFDFDFEKGIETIERGLAVNPIHSDARSILAHCYMIVGDWSNAWRQMNFAKEIDPLNPQVLTFSANMHFYQGSLLSANKQMEFLGIVQPSNQFYRMYLVLKGEVEDKKSTIQLLQEQYFSISQNNPHLKLDNFIEVSFEESQDFFATHGRIIRYLDSSSDQIDYLSESTMCRTLYYLIPDYDDELFFKYFNLLDERKNSDLPYYSIKSDSPLQKDSRYIAVMEKNGFW